MKATVQLEFNGNCRQAFEWYEKVLKGKIKVMNSFGDTEDVALPPGSQPSAPECIRFAEIQIGNDAILGNDVPADQFHSRRGFNLALHADSAAEATRIFNALSDGGEVTTPLTEVAWSPRFGQLVDRYGTPWLILALAK